MRTHLLQTIPAADVEPDTGCACNDACYGIDKQQTALELRLDVVVPATRAGAEDENDDYYLGGYAGI